MSRSSKYRVPLLPDQFDRNVEGLNSASLGAMGSLLRKRDDILCITSSAHQLTDDLKNISTKLAMLSEVDEPSLNMNYWMKDVRELSYDMEDCVDQLLHTEDPDAKIAWINNLLGFEIRVEEARERYDRYKLESGISAPITTVRHCFRRVYGEPRRSVVTVGSETPTNELRRLVEPKNDAENDLHLKVVSMLGVEGVGKSMLAQKIWRELGGQFQCQALVQIAKKPDMRMILRSILSQIHLQRQPESYQVPNLIHDIRKHLQDKRYLIIIDGLWSVPVWDVLSRCFPEGNHCSRIMITTTIEDVALACCGYDTEHIFWMKPLSAEHSNQLFISTVSGSGKGCPQQFSDISEDITRKCGGLPLAIICIASLVASQPEGADKSIFVQKFISHKLKTNSSSVEVLKQVLKLCYNSLPRCLKTCLLYLSIYPENYLFLKDDLVRQWIAEDFLSTAEGMDIIEVANICFDEILSLGLIQWMETGGNKKGLSYIVHPAVFDFVRLKAMEDNFITTIDYSQSTVGLTDKVRRLSLHFGSATYATPPASSIGLSQIRSLTFMGLLNYMPSLVEFRLVRVMILHVRSSDDEETRFSLTQIDKLLLLRYLQVRCNVTVELLVQVQSLKHMETVDINADVAGFPSDIVHHSSLQHVIIGKKRQHKIIAQGPITFTKPIFPEDLGNKSLAPVKVFKLLPPICSFSRLPRTITQLTELRILEVVVRELWTYDLNLLGKLPVLTVLSLYVRKPSTQRTTFHRSTSPFPALEYFKFMSGLVLLTFPAKGMPKLQRLKVRFNARGGEKYSDMLHGIHHLENLQEVVALIGTANGDEECDFRKSAESAFEEAIQELESLRSSGQISRNVKWVDKVDEEYDPLESSNKWGEISGIQKEDSTEHDESPGKLPMADRTHTLLPPWASLATSISMGNGGEMVEIEKKKATVSSPFPMEIEVAGRKRDCYRKHRFLSYLPSGSARSFEDSSRASSHHIPTYEFLGMIQRPPRWIGHFRNLRYLDAALREIQTYEVDVLAELWALTILSLYVRTPTAGGIRFKRAVFPALRHLTYKCGGVTLLNFESGAMPNLWTLSIGLNAHRGGKYGHMLDGIQHLLNLQEVSASIGAAFGADESDRKAAESALQNAISKHPGLPSFVMKRVNLVEGECEPSEKNRVQEIELSTEQGEVPKKQHGAHKEDMSNDQPAVLGKMQGRRHHPRENDLMLDPLASPFASLPRSDMKKRADASDEQHHQPQAPKKARSLVFLQAIVVVAITYRALLNPPGGLWQDNSDGDMAGDPILLTRSPMRYKAFLYCNTLALVASLLIIILLKKRVSLEMNSLKVAMIVDSFGLMGAFLAESWEASKLFFYVIVLADGILVYMTTHAVLLSLYYINGGKNGEVITRVKKMRRWLCFLSTIMLAATIILSPHVVLLVKLKSSVHNGNPVILYSLHYLIFVFSNLWSSVVWTSLIIHLIYDKNQLHRLAIPGDVLSLFTAATTCHILGAFDDGSTQRSKTSTNAFDSAVSFRVSFAVLISMVLWVQDNIENDMAYNPGAADDTENSKRQKWHRLRNNRVTLASLSTTVTMAWVSLPGRHTMGHPRLLVFVLSTIISWFGSFITITLLLYLEPRPGNKWWLRVVETMIVLEVLGLQVAFVAGSFGIVPIHIVAVLIFVFTLWSAILRRDS